MSYVIHVNNMCVDTPFWWHHVELACACVCVSVCVCLMFRYEWVMLHICMSHITHMSESCHTHAGVESCHMWMSHVIPVNESCTGTYMNESCHTYERVMSHICMSHVPYEWVTSHIWLRIKSCPTCEWVKSHMWMSHVTNTNKTCPTHEWVMAGTASTHICPLHYRHHNPQKSARY